MREYYIIKVNGEEYTTVYDQNDIVKVSCDLVNGCGIDPDAITIETVRRG